MLFTDADIVSAPMVMALKLANTAPVPGAPAKERSRTIGVALADTSARHFGVADFVENAAFSNTEVSFPCLIDTRSPLIVTLHLDACHPVGYQGSTSTYGDAIGQDGP